MADDSQTTHDSSPMKPERDRMAELFAALAEVQGDLPKIHKGDTAKVTAKSGASYTYKYVTLPDIHDAVLPLLSKHGLGWITKPTVWGEKIVLEYALVHKSGGSVTGQYPLPSTTSPQDLGSAITYGRRYTLCSVVGIAADEDDDGAAAQKATVNREQVNQEQPKAEKPKPAEDPAALGRAKISELCDEHNLDKAEIGKRFQAEHNVPIITASVNQLREFYAKILAETQLGAMEVPSGE